jgi:excisionase family DNA binding protein
MLDLLDLLGAADVPEAEGLLQRAWASDDRQDRLAVTVPEAARLMGLKPEGMWKLVIRGDVPSFKLGGRRLVPMAELQRLVTLGEPVRSSSTSS